MQVRLAGAGDAAGARPWKKPTASAPGQVSIRRAVPLNGSSERAKARGRGGGGTAPGKVVVRRAGRPMATPGGTGDQAQPRRILADGSWRLRGGGGRSSPWRPCGCRAWLVLVIWQELITAVLTVSRGSLTRRSARCAGQGASCRLRMHHLFWLG